MTRSMQCINRWLQLRLEFIGQAVTVMAALCVVLFRWPSDPGDPSRPQHGVNARLHLVITSDRNAASACTALPS